MQVAIARPLVVGVVLAPLPLLALRDLWREELLQREPSLAAFEARHRLRFQEAFVERLA
jgi:hypothetical protein